MRTPRILLALLTPVLLAAWCGAEEPAAPAAGEALTRIGFGSCPREQRPVIEHKVKLKDLK